MIRFRFTAVNTDGEPVSGEIEALDERDAWQLLLRRGINPQEISAIAPVPFDVRLPREADQAEDPFADVPRLDEPLSAAQAREVLGQISALGSAERSLVEGLRAAAVESSARPSRRALRAIAARLERGESLAAIFAAAEQRLVPRHLAGLVAAAAQCGRLGETLDELTDLDQQLSEAWRRLVLTLVYPVLVVLACLAVLLLLFGYVVPPFRQMLEEFELNLPAVTEVVLQISRNVELLLSGARIGPLIGFVVISTGCAVVLRLTLGAAAARRALYTTPLFGAMIQSIHAAVFARLLAVQLEHETPLPTALRRIEAALRDANFREVCRQTADQLEKGQRLGDVLEKLPGVPATLATFAGWADQAGQLPVVLRGLAAMYLDRVYLRRTLISVAIPPVLFLFVAFAVGIVVIAINLPLVALIQGLT